MHTEQFSYEVVWNGAIGHGVYLGALKGVEPFLAHEVGTSIPDQDRWSLTTGQLIVRTLKQKGPLTQTQLASACNRGNGDTRKSLMRLAKRGKVLLEQPCLLAIEPHHGQRWRLK